MAYICLLSRCLSVYASPERCWLVQTENRQTSHLIYEDLCQCQKVLILLIWNVCWLLKTNENIKQTNNQSSGGANRKQANQPPNRCRSLSMSFEWFYKFWAKGYNIMKSQIRMARGQLGLEIIILIECWLLKTNKNICRTVLRSILRQHWRPTYLP